MEDRRIGNGKMDQTSNDRNRIMTTGDSFPLATFFCQLKVGRFGRVRFVKWVLFFVALPVSPTRGLLGQFAGALLFLCEG